MRAKLLIPGISAIVALALSGPAVAAQPPAPAKSQLRQVPGSECGAKVSIGKALAISRGTAAFERQYARHPGLHSTEFRFNCNKDVDTLLFQTKQGKRVLDVEIDFRTGRVLKTWEGYKASWVMTRGYGDFFGRNINRWFVWLGFCLLFVIPFVNVRRPLRLLHLDLLVLVAGFGVSHYFFNRGDIGLSTPLAYPVLAYLLVRALVAGFRPREHRDPLVPHLPNAVLIAGLALLICFRIVFNVVDSKPIDVSYAGVAGADRITHGLPLYADGGPNEFHFDTYGPVNYLAYVPIEAVLPLRPDDPAEPGIPNVNDQPAAKAATILFDLLCLAGLFMLGAVARKGPAGAGSASRSRTRGRLFPTRLLRSPAIPTTC